MNYNIYVADAPLQFFAITSIIEQKKINLKEKDICFFFYKKNIFYLKKCELIFYDNSNFSKKIKSIWNFKKKIKQILSNGSIKTIHIAHPYHLPTNFLLFHIQNKKAYLIPDGVLNYSNKRIEFFQFISMIGKFALALMLGMTYRPYTGHLTAYNKRCRYRGVYTFKSDGLVTDCGRVCLIKKAQYPSITNKENPIYMILDQDIEKIFCKRKSHIFRQGMAEYLSKKRIHHVLYKSHPTQKNTNDWLIDYGIRVQFISSDLPIEMIFHKYSVMEVISFFSSALLNIQDMYPHIKCTAIMPSRSHLNLKNIKILFNKRGVSVVSS